MDHDERRSRLALRCGARSRSCDLWVAYPCPTLHVFCPANPEVAASRPISAGMTEWAYLVRTHFGDLSSGVKWNMMRLMLGAMQIHCALSSDRTRDRRTHTIAAAATVLLRRCRVRSSVVAVEQVSFDPCIGEAWTAILVGATLCLPSRSRVRSCGSNPQQAQRRRI